MSDTLCQVRGCRRPVQDAFVCMPCAKALEVDLRRIISGHQADVTVVELDAEHYRIETSATQPVRRGRRDGVDLVVDELAPGQGGRHLSSPWDHNGGLLADLVASYTRDTRTGRGGAASETPVVWHEKAGELRLRLCATLVRYARLVATARDVTLPDDAEPLTVADWLLRHVPWLRHQQAGAAAVTEIGAVVDEIMRIIDPIRDRVYAGPCSRPPYEPTGCDCDCHGPNTAGRQFCSNPDACDDAHDGDSCGRDLYALVGAVEVTCPDCRQIYTVAERRDWLIDQARDVLATATEIATALTRLEQPCTPERIRKWKERGRLVPHGEHPRTQAPLYRVGDVQDLLLEASAQQARRDARKAG